MVDKARILALEKLTLQINSPKMGDVKMLHLRRSSKLMDEKASDCLDLTSLCSYTNYQPFLFPHPPPLILFLACTSLRKDNIVIGIFITGAVFVES